MLQGFQLAGQASVRVVANSTHYFERSQLLRRHSSVARSFTQSLKSRARSKAKAQTHCSFASAISHTHVTAQSVTEAVTKATLERPLYQHALHSIFSSLAWFGLAWIVTRYIGRKAKECESPEASLTFIAKSDIDRPQQQAYVWLLAGAGTSLLVRAVPFCSAGQAPSLCPCWAGITGWSTCSCFTVPTTGSGCVLTALCSLVSRSGTGIRNTATELFRTAW